MAINHHASGAHNLTLLLLQTIDFIPIFPAVFMFRLLSALNYDLLSKLRTRRSPQIFSSHMQMHGVTMGKWADSRFHLPPLLGKARSKLIILTPLTLVEM